MSPVFCLFLFKLIVELGTFKRRVVGSSVFLGVFLIRKPSLLVTFTDRAAFLRQECGGLLTGCSPLLGKLIFKSVILWGLVIVSA